MNRFMFLLRSPMLWVLCALAIGTADAAVLVIDSRAYLYRAGGNVGVGCCGDLAPAEFDFAAAPGQTITFSSVTGTTDCDGGGGVCAPTGPDGNLGGDAFVGAVGSLSGITFRGSASMPLMGVFLDAGLPGAAPPTLDFRNAENFATVSPLLGQLFWVGDGLTGTGAGASHVFNVPNGASRLFLGFLDVLAGDNTGELTANFTLVTPTAGVPEPYTGWLVLAGCVALLVPRRRARQR